jgi:MFS family permease
LTATPQSQSGWRLVAVLGITQVIGYGSVFYSFSPLMHPLQESLQAGKGAVVGAFSVALLAAALGAMLVGKSIDRGHGRPVMAAGSAAAGLLLLALSRVETIGLLYLVYAGLGACMAAILYEPAFAMLTRSFGADARRAITHLTLIAGFASTVFWPLSQVLIETLGWRGAVTVLAVLNLAICTPLHLLFLPRGGAARPAARQDRTLGDALRLPSFYLFAGTLACNGLIFSTLSAHMIPILQAKGLPGLAAAGIAALVGPMQVSGRILEMTVGRRFPVARVALIALGAMPVALLALWAASAGSWMIMLFAGLYGASNGVFTIVRGALPLELFGREHYGAINGALSAPYLASHALAPFLAAALWTMTGGSYDRVLEVLVGVSLVAVVLCRLATVRRSAQG